MPWTRCLNATPLGIKVVFDATIVFPVKVRTTLGGIATRPVPVPDKIFCIKLFQFRSELSGGNRAIVINASRMSMPFSKHFENVARPQRSREFKTL